MQQDSTIIQILTFRPNVSFSNPATADGKLWNSALKEITRSQGWSELHWGSQLESAENVDLLIGKIAYDVSLQINFYSHNTAWTSNTDLRHFMAHSYQNFLNTVEPLLLHSSSSSMPLQTPHTTRLHPGTPSLELGAVSAIYEFSFNPTPDADIKTGLMIETQLCRNFFFDAAQRIGDGDVSFLGMDAVWVRKYDPRSWSSSFPPPAVTDSAAEVSPTGKTQEENVLLIITEWATQDAEKMILGSGRIEESRGGQIMTTGEYFKKNFLKIASGYTKHHVMFENVSASNVQWLDKEERWSTYVGKLMAADEDHRKTQEAVEPGV